MQPKDLDILKAIANQELDDCFINQGLGMWPQTSYVEQTVSGLNAYGGLNCNWLDIDSVDPCQPTQSCTVGAGTMQGGNAHWNGAHSGRLHTNRVDVDEYVESGAHDNVYVELNI